MKLFDLHADIGYDLYHKKLAHVEGALLRSHLPKLQSGNIKAVAMASFFYGHEDLATAQAMVHNLDQELRQHTSLFHKVLNGEFVEDRINVIMSLEGLGFLKEGNLSVIDEMYELGIRLASLTWNDQNDCATGISGTVLRGVSSFGEAVIERMNELKIVIDVSHLNEMSFWDVMRLSKHPVIATHSNAKSLCDVDRNLTDQQIKALIQQGGLIGLNAARNFVHKDIELQDANHLADHALHMMQLGGIDHIALGFDYMDFFNFEDSISKMAHDLQDASQSQNLIHALKSKGLSERELEKIAYKNAMNFFQNNL